jgi:hypothetical protein
MKDSPKLGDFPGFGGLEFLNCASYSPCQRKILEVLFMVYSPSKTEAYDFCSLKGKLMYRDKWELKEANNGTMGRIAGGAFAKGTERIHGGHSDGVSIGLSYFDQSILHYIKHGVSFSMDVAKARSVLEKAMTKYVEHNPFKTWQLKRTELELADYGRCRLDVLGIDPEGYWSIADLKYKRTLNSEYLDKTVNEYQSSWQFLHYPWAYNEYTLMANKGITDYQPATRIWLVLVIAEPFKVLTYPFFVNDQLQARWIQSAQQKWADIAAIESGDRQPIMAATHRDAYGECPMKSACFEMNLDENLMSFKYTKVPRMEV